MDDEGRKYWLSVAAFAVVLIAVVVTFAGFMQQTASRTVAQVTQYVSDATDQTATLVSTFMDTAQKDIEVIAAMASDSDDVGATVVNEEWLRSVSELTSFDSLDFVDASGIRHAVDRDPLDLSDRAYFADAMAGNSGVQSVFSSRLFGENLIFFYAPVREGANGPIIGLFLAHYSEQSLVELLRTSFFGYESHVFLCLPTGEVVAASDPDYVGLNLLDAPPEGADPSSRADLERALTCREGTTFTYQLAGGTGATCAHTVPGSDWMIVQTFPAEVTEQMIGAANAGGWSALFFIVIVFVMVIVGIIAYSNRRHRLLTSSMRDREDVRVGVAKITERLVIIDLPNDRFRFMSGPEAAVGRRGMEGSYDEMLERIRNLVVGEEAKAEAVELFSKESIVDLLPPGVDEVRFEYQMDRDGEVKWEDINLVCVERDESGRPVRLVYATQDVDALKEREKRLQQATEDSYRAALAANHAKSDFLSRMSHDIRTPMNAIIGMTELARMNEGDWKRVDDCLAKIDLSSNHLLSLINEVLDLSVIENGRLELSVDDVDLRAILKEAEAVFAPRCEAAGIRLTCETENLTHALVEGDELRIQQIFMNMLGNAVKFTPAGGAVSVRLIEAPSRIEGASDYKLVFADTGCGMAPEFLEHVFEPFAREHDSRTEGVQGTGLGLSIVQSVVSLMGGSIDVQSEPGVGTTFTVHLSMLHAEEGPTGQAAAAEESAQDTAQAVAGSHILLVEDNELNSEIAVSLLESLGATAETAENGQQALDRLAATEPGHFDAVLMDIQMPVMNGLDATRHIRESERADVRELPVIVLSANAFVEDVQKSKRAGANEHLSKPISVKDLSATLGRILAERAGAQ